MKPALPLISALLLAGCATRLPQGPAAPPAWTHAPETSAGTIGEAWWQDYGDPELDRLVKLAWRENPDIEVALQRIASTRADRFQALAAFFPTAALNLGFRHGREKTMETDFQAEDLKPWTAGGGISWELDLTGKRRAQLAAAKAGQAVAHARWKGSRLLIASEVCATRIEQGLMATELDRQRQQLQAETAATELSQTLLENGLISSTSHAQRVSATESLRRRVSELDRLTTNAGLRLSRLLGGHPAPAPYRGDLRIPATPDRIPAAVWQSRPDLIAAEAEVRQAFAIHDNARRDLLPTLSLKAGASVASSSPRDGFETWTTSVGPQLDIPIWAPARIAAKQRSQSRALAASAAFRATSHRAVEEIESAHVDLTRYREQLHSLERESRSQRKAASDAVAREQRGLSSAIERTDIGRAHLSSAAETTRMRLRALQAHLRLVRALGG